MNYVVSPSSLLSLSTLLHHPPTGLHFQLNYTRNYHHCSIGSCLSFSLRPSLKHQLSIRSTTPLNEGAIPVLDFEDFMEKDWSFLDTDDINSDEELKQKTDRIISAGEIGDTSKVLVSIGSEGFVDRVVESSPCQQLLVVHESLFTLAGIKEKYDKVNCWQGELIYLPEKWPSFDVVFLYFLPALPFDLGQVFGVLAKRCSLGARVVISHLQGREVLEQQRRQHSDVIVSNLPDKQTLQNVAVDHSFKMVEFVDELGNYLAVLKFKA